MRINAGAREHECLTSSALGSFRNEINIEFTRKALADLAMNHPEAFKEQGSSKINKFLLSIINLRISGFFCSCSFLQYMGNV